MYVGTSTHQHFATFPNNDRLPVTPTRWIPFYRSPNPVLILTVVLYTFTMLFDHFIICTLCQTYCYFSFLANDHYVHCVSRVLVIESVNSMICSRHKINYYLCI